MNVDNQTILHIKAGHLPPKELMKLIQGTKPTAFGFSVQEADGGDMQIMQEDGAKLDEATLNEFLEGRKERPTSMYFGKLAKDYDPEDIQPYVIRDGERKTFMSLFCEGDIVGHDADKKHTEQYNFVTGIIIPKVLEWCEDFEGDITKVMAKLNSSVFKNDVLMHIGHRGILHVLPFEGDPVLVGKNQLELAGDWGWISQPHGYGTKAVEAAPVEKKKGWWGSGKKASADAPVTPAPTTQPAPTKEPERVPPPPAASKPIAIAVKPPSWLHKNEDIKQFYHIVSGKGHPGWKKRLPVEVTQNHSVLECKSLAEYEKWVLANFKNKLEASSASMTSNAEKPQTKAERLAAQQKPAEAPIQGPVDNTPLPIIPPAEIEKVLQFVAQHLDSNSKEIIDPKEMQKIEAQLPKFSEQVGVTLPEMLNWPVSGVIGLGAKNLVALACWGLEWRAYARPYLLAEMKAKAKDGVQMTTETKTTDLGNGSKMTESIVKPVVAPAAEVNKAKSWGFGKKTAA